MITGYNPRGGGNDGGRMPYTSVVPRFLRERYILVAPIVIITTAGHRNVCIAETRKESISSLLLVANKDVRGRMVVLPE
jgi:hypothetical protein